jgi:cytochrome c biogenesis protein ResB
MQIIRNKYLPVKGFSVMNILGFLFVKEGVVLDDEIINHEAIHSEQQEEIVCASALVAIALCNFCSSWWYLLIVLVMPIAIYIIAWLIALVLPPYDSAYKDSPFEREAYANQHNPMYLATRPPFAWWKYIKNR